MNSLEVYKEEGNSNGTIKNTFRYKVSHEDVIPATAMGMATGVIGLVGSSLVGIDIVTSTLIATGLGTGASGGYYKAFMYARIKNSLRGLSIGNVEKPKLNQTRRTWKEKRLLLVENAISEDRKSKVNRELVTNRHGVWVEETIIPIATTAVQVKSWDTVLDSIIKVHGLEKLDMIASNTIPGLSPDGKKLSWRKTAGNILGELGVLQECTNRNCSTQCNHFF